MTRPWVAFFSQTGSEIVEVSKLLGRWPDLIVTNERPEHLRKIHPALENKHLVFVDNKPSWNQVISVIITEFGIDLLIIINFNKLYYI